MSNNNKQILYLGIDDSGNLTQNKYMAFGGIIFLNKMSLINFLKKYHSIVNCIKCKYCRYTNNCLHICPELKHYNLNTKHLNIFIDLLKKYHLMNIIINTDKIYKNILKNSKSKGRYLDYAIKIMVKNAIKGLIKDNLLNPLNDLELNIYIDENNYKSNGYYNLKESIYEELKYGINNFKYNYHFQNIIKGNLIINLYFTNSAKSYIIQASDLIAGYTRKNYLNNSINNLNIINYQIYLPQKSKDKI